MDEQEQIAGQRQWTIGRLLKWISGYFAEKGVGMCRLSAELLLADVLGLKRIELYTNFDRVVSESQLGRLHELIKRCGMQEPLAYVIGKTQFYGLDLKISADCMIPRPETELLVERAIEFLRARDGAQLVCDLCTGSGCIAVAIASNFEQSRIIATDISDEALKTAAENVEMYGLKERIELLCGDLFEPIIKQLDSANFDLIVCNPPYVTAQEYESLEKNVKDYEPRVALYAGADGLDVYRRIAERVGEFLRPGGGLMLEIGYAQGPAVRSLLEKTGHFGEIKIEKDFSDNDRVVTATRTAP